MLEPGSTPLPPGLLVGESPRNGNDSHGQTAGARAPPRTGAQIAHPELMGPWTRLARSRSGTTVWESQMAWRMALENRETASHLAASSGP